MIPPSSPAQRGREREGCTGWLTAEREDHQAMTKVTEVPGVPTVGTDYRDPDVTRAVSTGAEAIITIVNATGELTIHPETVAFGDSEHGRLMVPEWRGALVYQRGQGTVSPDKQYEWDGYCLGDKICEAIADGRIPLYSKDDLPESHRI